MNSHCGGRERERESTGNREICNYSYGGWEMGKVGPRRVQSGYPFGFGSVFLVLGFSGNKK